LQWQPPFLTFKLERHGWTVNGSSRASLHTWKVDLENRSAQITKNGHRTLDKPDDRLDCTKLAMHIAGKIQDGIDCDDFIWSDGKKTVTLRLETIIPTTNERTTSGRRKRFRQIMVELMKKLDWESRPNYNKMRFSRIDRTPNQQ